MRRIGRQLKERSHRKRGRVELDDEVLALLRDQHVAARQDSDAGWAWFVERDHRCPSRREVQDLTRRLAGDPHAAVAGDGEIARIRYLREHGKRREAPCLRTHRQQLVHGHRARGRRCGSRRRCWRDLIRDRSDVDGARTARRRSRDGNGEASQSHCDAQLACALHRLAHNVLKTSVHGASLTVRALDRMRCACQHDLAAGRQRAFTVWELERGDTLLSSRAVIASKIQAPSAPALPRERIAAQLGALWTQRFGLIVAPAGYGKTTAMTVFAASAGVPVAWYRVEAWDADEASLLLHLETALRRALPEVAGPWMTLQEAVASLEEAISAPALLVIDDVHTIEGTAAETVLERFIEYAPEALAILVASRSQPHFNLPRLRVLGRVVELGVDDLRFRTWEVEQLFRDFYGQPLGPHELAELARRTDGWAAGLHLFHLATRNRSGDERRIVLGALSSRSRMVREFLTRNVLDQLPIGLREFLVKTSVLGVLNGQLCDWYLANQGSQAILLELHRRRLFTMALDGENSFRYHEVLRAHLEGVLVDEIGEEAVQAACHRAGALLEEVGAVPEALRAYSRAGDADAVTRLLGRQGAALADQPGHWIESLPPALLENDPWLLLALARRHRAAGRVNAALDAYRRAEAGFAGRAIADVCRDERLRLQSWVMPDSTHPREGHWSGGLRAILDAGGEARSARPQAIKGARDALISTLAELIDGHLSEA